MSKRPPSYKNEENENKRIALEGENANAMVLQDTPDNAMVLQDADGINEVALAILETPFADTLNAIREGVTQRAPAYVTVGLLVWLAGYAAYNVNLITFLDASGPALEAAAAAAGQTVDQYLAAQAGLAALEGGVAGADIATFIHNYVSNAIELANQPGGWAIPGLLVDGAGEPNIYGSISQMIVAILRSPFEMVLENGNVIFVRDIMRNALISSAREMGITSILRASMTQLGRLREGFYDGDIGQAVAAYGVGLYGFISSAGNLSFANMQNLANMGAANQYFVLWLNLIMSFFNVVKPTVNIATNVASLSASTVAAIGRETAYFVLTPQVADALSAELTTTFGDARTALWRGARTALVVLPFNGIRGLTSASISFLDTIAFGITHVHATIGPLASIFPAPVMGMRDDYPDPVISSEAELYNSICDTLTALSNSSNREEIIQFMRDYNENHPPIEEGITEGYGSTQHRIAELLNNYGAPNFINGCSNFAKRIIAIMVSSGALIIQAVERVEMGSDDESTAMLSRSMLTASSNASSYATAAGGTSVITATKAELEQLVKALEGPGLVDAVSEAGGDTTGIDALIRELERNIGDEVILLDAELESFSGSQEETVNINYLPQGVRSRSGSQLSELTDSQPNTEMDFTGGRKQRTKSSRKQPKRTRKANKQKKRRTMRKQTKKRKTSKRRARK